MATITGSQPTDGNGNTIRFTGWDSANSQYVVDESAAGTPASGQPFSYAPKKVTISPANSGLPATLPAIAQKAAGASTGSVASLAQAFASNNVAGNSIVVMCGAGSNGTLSVTDSLGNTYKSAVPGNNSTTFESQIFYATNILGGANTVTVATTSSSSMAVQIYEVSGIIQQAGALGQTSSGSGTGTTASTSNLASSSPNALIFLGVAVGTTAEAITAVTGTNWTVDSSQNTTTPSGLYSFGALSLPLDTIGPITPQATIAASKPWCAVAAIFKPVVVGVQGVVTIGGYNPTNITSKTTTVVKTGPGVFRGIVINAPGSTDTLTVYDNTAASGTKIGTITVTAGFPYIYDAAFTTGLTVVSGGGTAGDYTVLWK